MSSNKNKHKPEEPTPRQEPVAQRTFKVITLSNVKVVGFIGGVQHNFLPLKSYEFPESERETITNENKALFMQNLIKIE